MTAARRLIIRTEAYMAPCLVATTCKVMSPASVSSGRCAASPSKARSNTNCRRNIATVPPGKTPRCARTSHEYDEPHRILRGA
eukprot:4639255-Pyramimonas_sp.AAC.1